MSHTPPGAAYPSSLEVVAFSAGGYRFAVEAGQVRASHLPQAGDGSPSMAALLGLAEAGGTPGAGKQLLTIKQRTADRTFAVDAPVRLLQLPAAAIHPLPDLVAARSRLPVLRALALDADGLTLLLDLQSLL